MCNSKHQADVLDNHFWARLDSTLGEWVSSKVQVGVTRCRLRDSWFQVGTIVAVVDEFTLRVRWDDPTLPGYVKVSQVEVWT